MGLVPRAPLTLRSRPVVSPQMFGACDQGLGIGVLGLGFGSYFQGRGLRLGFEVWDWVSGVWGLGFGVWSLGFRVWGLEFEVRGLGFWVWFGVWGVGCGFGG